MKNVMLATEGLSKRFGGISAVRDVNLQVANKEFSCIIGPNGAGKSTLFNLLTGHIKADKGRIILKGKDITSFSPHSISRRGVGRSFQRVHIFPRLTVFENIQTAVLCGQGKSLNLFGTASRLYEKETKEIMDSVGLSSQSHRVSDELAYGDKKRLEFAIALSGQPELLLLDEPTAGMSPDEGVALMKLLRSVSQDRGLTVIFVEHDMSVVFGFSDYIRVMHAGGIIAEGKPDEIRLDPQVKRIYLGEEAI